MGGFGSPPHVRGKDFLLFYRLFAQRITPACAGKSGTVYSVCCTHGDHPRMCGEKRAGLAGERSGLGSPPHVRGKVFVRVDCRVVHGITPACAGKSLTESCGSTGKKDHPRMCGEKDLLFWPLSGLKGSPPHVRGNGTGILQNLQRVGIAPACAGKRGRRRKGAVNGRDHPRMCGEKPPLKGYCT